MSSYPSPALLAPSGNRTCSVVRCGVVPYETAWQWQQSLVQARRDRPTLPDVLLLLEHFPVYTLGKGADEQFVKFSPDESTPAVIRVERGGEVTYHCPGQLVGYPILNLQRQQPDLHHYLRQLEEVVIQTVAVFGLVGERVSGLTGVWVAGRKVAAIGIKVSRWITMHGFALNVCPEMAGFKQIIPCGIGDRPVGKLTDFVPNLTVAEVHPVLEAKFAEVFGYQLISTELAQLMLTA